MFEKAHTRRKSKSHTERGPTGTHLFQINNGNIRRIVFEICSKITTKPERRLLTLNRFHNRSSLFTADFKQVNSGSKCQLGKDSLSRALRALHALVPDIPRALRVVVPYVL